MAQIGDTVRFLNTVGGGKITKIDGKIAFVEENGFETPVLLSEVVVVLPAGHEPEVRGAKKMFDQKAFDEGKSENRSKPVSKELPTPEPPKPEALPVVETPHGDDITVALAFEPADIRKLSETQINVVLVNDSNYFLSFALLNREKDAAGWCSVYQGEVAPNELIDLTSRTQKSIADLERLVFQAIAFKKEKTFEIKSPINVSKKIDLTKFYKVHCFRPGIYFDTPVIEVPLYTEKKRK